MLNPLVVKNFQLCGGFANVVAATEVGNTKNRGPGKLMKSVARRLFNGVRKPFTRDRKYQTKLGS